MGTVDNRRSTRNVEGGNFSTEAFHFHMLAQQLAIARVLDRLTFQRRILRHLGLGGRLCVQNCFTVCHVASFDDVLILLLLAERNKNHDPVR